MVCRELLLLLVLLVLLLLLVLLVAKLLKLMSEGLSVVAFLNMLLVGKTGCGGSRKKEATVEVGEEKLGMVVRGVWKTLILKALKGFCGASLEVRREFG